nr:MAG TPA: hypothetical protein [Caudoviricetes sp.]
MGALYICRWAHLWADISHLVERQPLVKSAAHHQGKQVVLLDEVPKLFPFFQAVTLQVMDNTKVVTEVVRYAVVFIVLPVKTPRVLAYLDWSDAHGTRKNRLSKSRA